MPILATVNIKDCDMFNTMMFKINNIDYLDKYDMKITVGKDVFNLVEFRNCFIPAFCVTVYKYQGAGIDEPYNIYDVNLMDKTTLYCIIKNYKIRVYTP